MKKFIEFIECAIEEYTMKYLDDKLPVIKEGIFYSLKNGGKRVRPTLMLMTATFLGISWDKIAPLAVALECIHTYSLVHDDLPCMDNDDFRRGKPTSHKIFGEGYAVLIGDSLLNLAYEIIIGESMLFPELLKAGKCIAENSGSKGMIKGQFIDIKTKKYSLDEIKQMYNFKTGGLIKAGIIAPLLTTNYDDLMYKNLVCYAENVGYAFQLVDDILDFADGTDKDKITLVNIFGEHVAKAELVITMQNCIDSLTSYGERSKELLDFAKNLAERTI